MVYLKEAQKTANRLSSMAHRVGPGFVYFFVDGERIKIGFSKNPEQRLVTVQQSHPKPLWLAYQTPGTLDDEKTMHDRFRHLWITGEWFVWHADILEYIENRQVEEEEDRLEENEEDWKNFCKFFPKEAKRLSR